MFDSSFVLASYLIGALPLLYLLGLACGKRLSGDLHMQLWWQCGPLYGLTGIFIDVARGVLMVLVGKAMHLDISVVVLGSLAVLAGQMWPVLHRFNGEKGNTTALGIAVSLTPAAFLVAAVPMLIGGLARTIPHLTRRDRKLKEKIKFKGPPSRSLPLGMILGFAVLPIASNWLHEERDIVLGYLSMFILIVIKRATAPSIEEGPLSFVRRLTNRLLYDRPT